MKILSIDQLRNQISTKPLERRLMVERSAVDETNRTAEFSVSSEFPVEQWFGFEILDHSPESIDLSRFIGGAAHRDTHFGDQIGIIDNAMIDQKEKKLRVTVRYSKNQRAQEIFQDVLDGIRKNVSLRYEIHDIVLDREVDGTPYYRATKWEPIHTSEEPDPADPTVGHGRSAESETVIIPIDANKDLNDQIEEINKKNERGIKILLTNKKRSISMTDEEKQALAIKEAADRKVAIDEARSAETSRVKNIYAVAGDFQRNVPGVDLRKEADKFIAEGKSDSEFRTMVMEKMKSPEASRTPATQLGMSGGEVENYSLRKAILALATGDRSSLGIELEASKEIEKKLNREVGKNSILVPWDVQMRKVRTAKDRDLVVGTPANGGYAVQYQYTPLSFLEILQNSMVTSQLGVTILDGLIGNVPMTRELTKNIFYWAAESAGPTQSDVTFAQDTMTPKTGGALTKMSHKFLMQNSIGGEAYVTRKLALASALGYDLAALYGSGSASQPKGLKNVSGIGGVVGTAFTRAKALAMVAQIKSANALTLGGPKFLTNPTTSSTLQLLDTTTGYGKWLLDQGKMVNTETVESNQLVDGDLFAGVWEALLLGMWGVVEIKANEFGAGFAAGDIEVRALVDMDVFVEYPAAFSYAAGVAA